jgi:hypothetical protein
MKLKKRYSQNIIFMSQQPLENLFRSKFHTKTRCITFNCQYRRHDIHPEAIKVDSTFVDEAKSWRTPEAFRFRFAEIVPKWMLRSMGQR